MKQNRPWLPTAILAGVAVLLAVFAIWVVPQLGEPPQGDGDQPDPIILFAFQGQDVVRMSVTQGFMMAVVERTGLGWQVVSPTAGEADNARLDDLAVRIASMRSTRALEGVAQVERLLNHLLECCRSEPSVSSSGPSSSQERTPDSPDDGSRLSDTILLNESEMATPQSS